MLKTLLSTLGSFFGSLGPKCGGIRVVMPGGVEHMNPGQDKLPQVGDEIETPGGQAKVVSAKIADMYWDFIWEVEVELI